MRKWTCSSLLFLSLTIPTVATAAWEGSWLIGLSGGFSDREGDINATVFHPAPGLQVSAFNTSNTASYDSGYLWGLLAGYELANNAWVLGLEVNLDWKDKRHKGDDNVFAFTDSINNGWVYAPHYMTNAVLGLTGRVGYQVFTYLIPYIRAGAEYSDNKLRFSAFDPTQRLYTAGDSKRHMMRFVGGAGAEVPLPGIMVGLSARLEYNYHSEGKTVNTIGLASNRATLWNLDGDASTNSVKASIVWNLPF